MVNSVDYPNVHSININDQIYPNRIKRILGEKAPSTLQCLGNLDLLQKGGLGFCGSRKSSAKGLETAQDCSRQAAVRSIVVVSGNAAGVDFEAHYSALKSGGSTILVLPEGINKFRIKKKLKDVWDWNRVLVVSQFEFDSPWRADRAMTRNRVIIALSNAMIVIEAGAKGGTMNAGLDTLRLGLPLFVAQYQDMSDSAQGNQMLLQRGGIRLAKSRSTGLASMEKVFDAVRSEMSKTYKTIEQQSLF